MNANDPLPEKFLRGVKDKSKELNKHNFPTADILKPSSEEETKAKDLESEYVESSINFYDNEDSLKHLLTKEKIRKNGAVDGLQFKGGVVVFNVQNFHDSCQRFKKILDMRCQDPSLQSKIPFKVGREPVNGNPSHGNFYSLRKSENNKIEVHYKEYLANILLDCYEGLIESNK